MDSIALSIIHSTVQLGVGVVAGSLIDYVFPEVPKAGYLDGTDALIGALEVAAQTVVNSIVLGGVMSSLLNMDVATEDPAQGAVFIMTLLATQNKYVAKIKAVVQYIEGFLGLDVDPKKTYEPSDDSGKPVRIVPKTQDLTGKASLAAVST